MADIPKQLQPGKAARLTADIVETAHWQKQAQAHLAQESFRHKDVSDEVRQTFYAQIHSLWGWESSSDWYLYLLLSAVYSQVKMSFEIILIMLDIAQKKSILFHIWFTAYITYSQYYNMILYVQL